MARNEVLKHDATCHAEINAIRKASEKIKTFDLSGCVIYSTTEPCPMCFSAAHWARISVIIYGTSILDAKKAGFNELNISNIKMKKMGGSSIKVYKDFLREECAELLDQWSKFKNKVLY